MAVRLSTDLRNVLANAIGSGFNSGTFEIRTGSQPATANTAASGTLLVTISLPGSPFGSASAGSVAKQGSWSASASASGTAGWGRLTGGGNVIDVSIGESGADFIIDNASIVEGGTVTVVSGSVTVPAG